MAQTIDTRKSVATMGGTNEISRAAVQIPKVDYEPHIYPLPVVFSDSVLAILHTDNRGFRRQPQIAATELLTFLTEARIKTIGTYGESTPIGQRKESLSGFKPSRQPKISVEFNTSPTTTIRLSLTTAESEPPRH